MNLMVCCTGLQVLIAEKILLEYPTEQFALLMFKTLDNRKNDHYFNRLANNSQIIKAEMIVLDANNVLFYPLSILKNLLRVKKSIGNLKLNKRGVDKIFFSYITDLYIHVILNTVAFNEIYTFDDGTANIVSSSFLYKQNVSWKRKAFYCLLGLLYNELNLRPQIKLHYTIYPNMPNIIEKTQIIRLFDEKNIKSTEQTELIKIMIGQFVFYDERDIALTQRIIDEFKIDYYFPSPRESYIYDSVEYMNTPLILEDYFIQYWSDKKCIVYTYFSSGALNISELPNVEIIALKPQGLNNHVWKQVYKLFSKFGIKVKNYEF